MEEDPPSYLQTTTSLSTCSPHTTTSSSASPSSCSPSRSQEQYDHQWRNRMNLPSGMFLLKNVAQGKTLDLLGHKSHEGAPLGVHPIKEPILKGLSLQHSKNNQLFFLDWNGHLYSAAVSRAVDVVDDQLSIALPHPIQMYPSKLSHPLPRFYLDPTTKTLEILFSHDPDFPPPQHPTSTTTSFQEYDYLVETVPLKNKYKNKRRASRIEGLLEKVNGFNPFNQINNNNKNNNVTAGGGGGRNDSVVSSNLEKRLPRDRDASLPPPPIPSKHEDASPPSPPPLPSRPSNQQSFPPPSNYSIFTSSPSPNTTITDLQARFEKRRNSKLPSSPRTFDNNSNSNNNNESSPSPTCVSKPQFSGTLKDTTILSDNLLRRESIDDTNSEEEEEDQEEEEENESEDLESESDDEPSGFRPVRVVKILKSTNWRENQYPFHNTNDNKHHSVGAEGPDDSNKVFPGSEEEEESNRRRRNASISTMTSEAHPTPPIGLGFDQLDNSDNSNNSRRDSSSHQAEEEDTIEELTAENVWPESIHLRETSFTSNASTVLDPHHHHQQRISSSSYNNPPVSMSRTERRKIRKQELKEIRKWRRRQWEVIPVKIEPVPVDRGSTSSWRVQNDDLDQEFYTFRGGVGGEGEEENRYELESEDEEEVEEEEVPQPNSIAQVVMTKEKRGSIETAKSVVSGVGSFLTSKLLWSVSTSSTPQQPSHFVREEEEEEEEEEALPPLPLMNEAEQDAEELKSDELEKFGKRNRRKSSLVTTSPPLPELPQLAPITALEVPLPDSIPNTPQIGRTE